MRGLCEQKLSRRTTNVPPTYRTVGHDFSHRCLTTPPKERTGRKNGVIGSKWYLPICRTSSFKQLLIYLMSRSCESVYKQRNDTELHYSRIGLVAPNQIARVFKAEIQAMRLLCTGGDWSLFLHFHLQISVARAIVELQESKLAFSLLSSCLYPSTDCNNLVLQCQALSWRAEDVFDQDSFRVLALGYRCIAGFHNG